MGTGISKKRVLAALMILAIAMAFWFACAVRANAAATKTINVVTEQKAVQKTEGGDGYTIISKYAYFKTGLLKSVTDEDPDVILHARALDVGVGYFYTFRVDIAAPSLKIGLNYIVSCFLAGS